MGENFDRCDGASAPDVHLQHTWNRDESVTASILEGIAAVTDTPLTDLDPPLYEIVDPDALDRLCEPPGDDGLRDGHGQLTFYAYDCTVRIHWDGTIEIDPPDES